MERCVYFMGRFAWRVGAGGRGVEAFEVLRLFDGVPVREEQLRFCAMVMQTKWFQTARLETRTKESNMCASV